MRTHTNDFKNEISKMGKQINGKIYYYHNYDLITEDDNTIITEDNIKLISEQINYNDKELIDNELIYSMNLIKNGEFLHSLMKEFDFEAKFELKIGDIVNPYFGLLVNNNYEYLNYGNYIIYSKEYIAESQSWKYICYDKMLYSMVQYKPLDITYPCTIREYLIALANRIGLNFANANDTFTNYNQQVLEELFEGQNITYRDILDKLSEITASNILINDNDELELGYPSETNDIINEENLKDVNVNFGEVFGPINKVAIVEIDGGYEYSAQNDSSIEVNGLTQVNIVDNIFAFNDNSEQIAQSILNKINGLSYSINDFSTTGVCYYDYLDLFNVSIENNIYKCLLLNNEIKISEGLEEKIYTDKLEKAENESNNYKLSNITNKQVQFQINKQKGEIRSSISALNGDISALTQRADSIELSVASKVGNNEVINKINASTEGIAIDGTKISLNGKTINMTSDNIKINSTNFNVDESGNCTANSFSSNNATITGGSMNISNSSGNNMITLTDNRNNTQTTMRGSEISLKRGNDKTEITEGDINLAYSNGNNAQLSPAGITVGTSSNFGYYLPAQWRIKSSSGETRCDAGGTPTPISDRRLKDNIKNINKNKSINIIKELNPVEYTLKNQEKIHRGLIAQEVVEVLNKNNIKNQIYDINENGYYMLCYTELIPDLINCVKYQQEQIEILQKQVQDLERKIK